MTSAVMPPPVAIGGTPERSEPSGADEDVPAGDEDPEQNEQRASARSSADRGGMTATRRGTCPRGRTRASAAPGRSAAGSPSRGAPPHRSRSRSRTSPPTTATSRSCRHPQRGRPVAEQPGDDRVGTGQEEQVARRPGAARPRRVHPPARPERAAPRRRTRRTRRAASRRGPTIDPPASAPCRRRGSAPRGRSVRSTRNAVAASAGTIRSPIGHQPDRAEAADRGDRRQDERLDRDAVLRRRARRAGREPGAMPNSVATRSRIGNEPS